MAKSNKPTRKTENAVTLSPGMIPILGGLKETPLETVRDAIGSAASWLRSQPRVVVTKEECELLLSLSRVGPGNIDAAITQLRKAMRRHRWRIRLNPQWLLRRVLLRQRPATILCELLAMLLNVRAVTRVNGAIKDFQDNQPQKGIYEQLKARARLSPFGSTPYLHGLGNRASREMLRQLHDYDGFHGMGTCEFCSGPAVGELRCSDGQSWKVCPLCAHNAELIRDEHNAAVDTLRSKVANGMNDLEEAVRVHSSCQPARVNLKACQEILSQLGG